LLVGPESKPLIVVWKSFEKVCPPHMHYGESTAIPDGASPSADEPAKDRSNSSASGSRMSVRFGHRTDRKVT